MKNLNMKKGSYQKFPYKKDQIIDGITILENDFSFIQDRYYVKFLCRCGKEDFKRISHLKRMKYKCCRKCSRKNKYPEQRKARNHFENGIHKQWINCVKQNLNRGSKELKCDINNLQLSKILEQQNFKCIYTGIDLKVKNILKRDSNASIDRIDSNKDYTEDNIQWVYKPINIMKNGLSSEEFIKMCKEVANFIR